MNISFDKHLTDFNQELERILNFWLQKSIDNKNGGFYGEIGSNGEINNTAPKGAVLNARILWTFSAAYNYSKDPQYLEAATRAYYYFTDYFLDKENGGVFWELAYDGKVINHRKQSYAQGFAIYGLSEYYIATNNPESLQHAINIYNLLETNCLDTKNGGYVEALAKDWSPLEDMRLSPKDANEPKSMNTHLHILEPYTNLYRVHPNGKLADSMQNIIRLFLDKILNNSTNHLNLFFDYNWDVKSSMISYGHDIEGAWLLTEAAEVLGNSKLLKEVEEKALKIADVTIREGIDSDGSVYYEKEGGHLDTDKHWWPQAEAIVGFLNAYTINRDKKYLEHALKSWQFIQNNIVDKQNGEWFWRVNKDGIYYKDVKAGFWKCPYHNSRAMIEAIQRLQKISKGIH